MKLDNSLKTIEERVEFTHKLIAETPDDKLSPRFLEIMADYILEALPKKEKQEKYILTPNHMITINKREMSFEGLADKFQNGENGIYGLITNDKNILFTPKISITPEDIAAVPGLKQLVEAIAQVREMEANAHGARRYQLKKTLIEMYQDQYVLKNRFLNPNKPIHYTSLFDQMNFYDDIYIDEEGNPHNDGLVSFFNPKHISALLCNYSNLKEAAYGHFRSDLFFMMEDLDNLIEKTLKDKHPYLYKLLIYKIDGMKNEDIKRELEKEFDISHTIEYISSLWRNKIPKLLAEAEEKNYLTWYYTKIDPDPAHWKTCSRCGTRKPANLRFFSRNGTSKDGFYSICKDCRKEKKKNANR